LGAEFGELIYSEEKSGGSLLSPSPAQECRANGMQWKKENEKKMKKKGE